MMGLLRVTRGMATGFQCGKFVDINQTSGFNEKVGDGPAEGTLAKILHIRETLRDDLWSWKNKDKMNTDSNLEGHLVI